MPIGGGGLAAGVSSYFKQISPETKIIGLEPQGASSMIEAIKYGEPVTLDEIDKFVDGAAVKRVGQKNFEICKDTLEQILSIPEGEICTNLLRLYNEEGIIVEPTGVLGVFGLNYFKEQIKGKTVICILSGGNNDIARMAEINERAIL